MLTSHVVMQTPHTIKRNHFALFGARVGGNASVVTSEVSSEGVDRECTGHGVRGNSVSVVRSNISILGMKKKLDR